MQDYELDAYLDAAGDVTPEQRAALKAALERVSQRFPEEGDTDATGAGSAAAQVILGDADVALFAREWVRVRTVERDAWAELVGAMIGAAAAGVPETRIAQSAGVARMTVRKALGK